MESSPSHPSKINITCMTLDSRALCAVCGAPAIGRNFDAYTCLSCKAFFRRNGYNEHLRYTCRLKNSCEITIATRRHCSACRLNKCFRQGMKKELIRSLIAINHASLSAMMVNRQSNQRLITRDLIPSNNQSILSLDDWNIFTNIRNTYENYCVKPFLDSHERIPLSITTQPYRSRLKIQRFIDIKEKYLTIMISFIKQILNYHTTLDNPYDYIRENLSVLVTINTSELMRSNILKHTPWENDRFLFESVLTEQILERLEQMCYTYRNLLPYDSLIVKLFLIILALNSRISTVRKQDQYSINHFQPFPMEIIRIQNYYIALFWKYVIHRFGYYDAIMYSVRFIQYFLHRQIIEADIVDTIENRDDHGQLAQHLERILTK